MLKAAFNAARDWRLRTRRLSRRSGAQVYSRLAGETHVIEERLDSVSADLISTISAESPGASSTPGLPRRLARRARVEAKLPVRRAETTTCVWLFMIHAMT